MRKYIYTVGIALTGISMQSQTLQEAMVKTDNERFEAADKDLRSLISKDPSKGEYYFNLGENFFANGIQDRDASLIDSANFYYAKGSEINATNALNYVGLGKVLLYNGKTNDAKAQFFKAASVAQNKNAEVMRRTAEAWILTDNKNPDEAIAQLNNAIKLDSKTAENYILMGDAQLEKNPTDGSGPIKSYQQATTLNPKSAKGILREGKLYQRGRNYQLALEKYKAALTLDPTFAPAYREIAELYYLAGQNSKSIEHWKKYLELNNSDYARYRFMSALFKNKQYSDAITEYENLKKSNFKNVYLDRIAGMSYYEIGDAKDKDAYSKGLDALNDFFNSAGPKFKYLGSDFKYKGMLLMKTGKDSLGMIELEKAIQLDTSMAGEIYSEIAYSNYKNKNYEGAVNYYEKKIGRGASSMNNNDWYNLGKSYYFPAVTKLNEAANTKDAKVKAAKEAEAIPALIKADSAFANLVRKNPSWIPAYVWRGRANSLIDSKVEREDTKLIYEKVLSLIKPEELNANKKDAVEAYEYLGAYYLNKKDKAKADEMWTKVKELDPENQKAKYYFTPPKQPVKK
ncbi:MAG: tetratricopeptide repeat protein [Sphingobacteriaceae bacterium]|nr:tetratricopeptide repeat protein [Sphingobacteriaceae bacterium]